MRRRKKKQSATEQAAEHTAESTTEQAADHAAEAPARELPDLAQLLAERNALEDKLKRALADMANMRRRLADDVRRASEQAIGRIAQEIVPIIDSFGLALEAGGDKEALLEGVKMAHSMLEDLLGRRGVERVRALDEPFDPRLHEAVGVVPRDDVAPNTVVAVHQTGLRIGDRVLRPARVVVSQLPPTETGESDSGDDAGDEPAVEEG